MLKRSNLHPQIGGPGILEMRPDKPCIGELFAIDGTLCKCAMKGKSNECYSRKGQKQLNVQVMCNWNLDLVYVNSNYSGRAHDNDMLLNSPLYHALQNDMILRPGGFIIGDEGYIVRPYGNNRVMKEWEIYMRSHVNRHHPDLNKVVYQLQHND